MPIYIKKIGLYILIIWGAVTFIFATVHILPGDPIDYMLGENIYSVDKDILLKEYKLDIPVYKQYIQYLKKIIGLDFGKSYFYKEKVLSIIKVHFYNTLLLSIASIIAAITISLIAGIFAGYYKHSLLDRFLVFITSVGMATPNFWLGPMLILIFAIYFDLVPVSGKYSFSSYILPVFTLSSGLTSFLTRIVRSSIIRTLNEPFVTTLHSYGIKKATILFKYVLKVSAIPIVTIIGLQLGALLSGAVITETIYSWPGMGRLLIDSITRRDYPLILGLIIIITFLYIFINASIDMLYIGLNPKLRKD